MRLIDEIRRSGAFAVPRYIKDGEETADFNSAIRTSFEVLANPTLPVIEISNVAEFFFKQSDQEVWGPKDFPNVAPPFPIFWMEYRMPNKINSEEFGQSDFSEYGQLGRIGLLVVTAKAADMDEELRSAYPDCPDGGWTGWIRLFKEELDKVSGHTIVTGPLHDYLVCVGPEGVLGQQYNARYIGSPEGVFEPKNLLAMIHPMYLAISFFHCKNVEVVDNEVDKPLAKRYFERHGVRPTKYKTLIIDPLKKILRNEGQSEKTGLQKALHICRGHFKDYRQGKGLFGKFHKLVWHPSTVRGTVGDEAPPRSIKVKI